MVTHHLGEVNIEASRLIFTWPSAKYFRMVLNGFEICCLSFLIIQEYLGI